MALVKRLMRYLRPARKARRGGYTEEVLYAGWVDIPLQPGKQPGRR